jgi:nicotinamide mononucleotide (NMN) deamidase PncC
MRELAPIAEDIASLLKTRGETLAVVESSAGGLISVALLAISRQANMRAFAGAALDLLLSCLREAC